MLRAVAAILIVMSVVVTRSDVQACGDHSLSAGGIRMQRALAARYPAAILIYAQPASRLLEAARELKLTCSLQQVGHRYLEVATWPDLYAALQSGQWNIVMADVGDVADLQTRLESTALRPVILPVAYKLTKAETAEVARQCRLLVKAPSRAAQYLTTIAEAVRSKGTFQKG